MGTKRSDKLPPFSKKEPGIVQVIIETPKGSRNKYKFESKTGLYTLGGVLSAGMAFPFDFGFVPSTKAADGDPIDVLVLMDEPAFPGCLVPCRILGVLLAEQTEEGKTERNDRLIAVSNESEAYSDLKTLSDVNGNLMRQIEHFFVSYNKAKGKKFKILDRAGPADALKVLKKSIRK